MPQKKTIAKARKDAREGKAPTTQAGEFVREEMKHAKQGRHSKGNPKQAIAIGLSMARRAGVKVKPPKKGRASAATRKKAARDYAKGQSRSTKTAKKAVKKVAKKTASKRAGTTVKKRVAKKAPAKKTAAKRKR